MQQHECRANGTPRRQDFFRPFKSTLVDLMLYWSRSFAAGVPLAAESITTGSLTSAQGTVGPGTSQIVRYPIECDPCVRAR